MISYARLRPGRGFAPAHAAAYYIQRCVTHLAIRRFIASILAAVVRLRHSTLATRTEPDLQAALGDLERDGIAMLPNLFSASQLEDVVAFFLGERVAVPGGGCTHDALAAGLTMAAYDLATVTACPWLMAAINSADILRLASAFLGCTPTLCSVGVRWSFPDPKSPDVTQAFHRDPDDWRFLKLFVYLTDVDGESGPHVYVAGSHKTRTPWRVRTYTQELLEARFGKQNMRPVVGARGTTFVADTSGIHAGVPPRRVPRLLLQAQYSILPNFALYYRPVAGPGHHRLDSYVNRLILDSSVR